LGSDHLQACCDSHRRAGHQLLLVAEVIESPGTEIADRIRSVRPDELSRGSTDRRRQVAP
jgi:hypothetical protein